MVRKIDKWGIRFKDSEGRTGRYYIAGSRKLVLKEVKDLRERIPKVKWTVIKYKANAWVKKK
jgi:hypothetical protein